MSPIRCVGFAAVLIGSFAATGGLSAQNLLQRLAEQLERTDERDTLPPPRDLDVPPPPPAATPPSLGVRLAPVTEEAVRAYRLTVRRGALITAIEQGSAADKAGLPLGAVIVAVSGRRVDSPDEAVRALRALRAGDEVELTYYEGDRLTRKRVRLGAAGAPALLPAEDASRPVPPATAAAPRPRPADSLPTLPSLDSEPAGTAKRPILNRLGRILEDVVAPALATQPVDPAPPAGAASAVSPAAPANPIPAVAAEGGDSVAALQQQVDALRRQVEQLQRQVESLERKLNAR